MNTTDLTLAEVEKELNKIPGFACRVAIESAKLRVAELLKTNPHASAVERLQASGLVLPEPKEAVGMYDSVFVNGNRLLVSGHGPWVNGKPICGKVGSSGSGKQLSLLSRSTYPRRYREKGSKK